METFLAKYQQNLINCMNDGRLKRFDITEWMTMMRGWLKAQDRRVALEGPALKATCKELKIKMTYKAIFHYVNNHA